MRKTSLMFLLAALAILSISCIGKEESSTIANACQKKDGSLVAVEGFLLLPHYTPTRMNAETELTTYELSLADRPDAGGDAIRVTVVGTRSNKTNRIAELPMDGYTRRDLQIFTDTGETLTSRERVRVTGEMLKRGSGYQNEAPCTLTVEKIERP